MVRGGKGRGRVERVYDGRGNERMEGRQRTGDPISNIIPAPDTRLTIGGYLRCPRQISKSFLCNSHFARR